MEADEMNDAKTVVNKLYPCDICDKTFPRKSDIRQHIEQVHEKKNRQKCVFCDGTFSNSGNLRQHIAKVHEGKTKSEDKQNM